MLIRDLFEVNLGNYSKKAKMASALAKMGAAFGNDPEQRARDLDIARRRDADLARAQTRYDKTRTAAAEKSRADALAADQAALPQMQAQLKKLQSQFDPNFEYSDDHGFWSQQKSIQQQIQSLQKRIAAAQA